MNGAVVVDKVRARILRANFHLNPDATLSNPQKQHCHRNAARMSLSPSIVIAVSSRRSLITVYVDGHVIPLKSVPAIMSTVNQPRLLCKIRASSLTRAYASNCSWR